MLQGLDHEGAGFLAGGFDRLYFLPYRYRTGKLNAGFLFTNNESQRNLYVSWLCSDGSDTPVTVRED
jgi:hypothetical protein